LLNLVNIIKITIKSNYKYYVNYHQLHRDIVYNIEKF